jgi:hypothetical protein
MQREEVNRMIAMEKLSFKIQMVLIVLSLIAIAFSQACAPALVAGAFTGDEAAFQTDMMLRERKEVDYQICSRYPKLRPYCLFDENGERRWKLYQQNSGWEAHREELLDAYSDELDKAIELMEKN